MSRADNTAYLAQANARRHQATLAAARHAIEQLQREGQAINYTSVARTAGVSRPWLYRQHQIRDLISQLRQRLDTARAEITRLRTENRSLREQIARQLGLQRTQHHTDPPAEHDDSHPPAATAATCQRRKNDP
jgi:hypothetical protein